MKNTSRIFLLVAAATVYSSIAWAQTGDFFKTVAGHWEGSLEYQDYSADKRVKLRTYLTITPSADGGSAEFATVYDDFGRIIKERRTVRIDVEAKSYTVGDNKYLIDVVEAGRIVLLGSGQDGNSVEPSRTTITFDSGSLDFLKETRTPWRFRNRLTLKRSGSDPLALRTLSAEQLKEDLSVLQRTLEAIHPGVYRYQSPESLKRLFAEAVAELKGPLTEKQFFRSVARLTSQIRCGHTYLNPNNQNALLRERLFNGRTYLPFYFRILGGKIIVTENASPVPLPRGTEIAKINGLPSGEIVRRLLGVTTADGRNTMAHRLSQIELTRFAAERYALFDWYFPLEFPSDRSEFDVEAVDATTGKRKNVLLPAMTKAERTSEMEKRYGKAPTYDDGWEFKIRDDGVAYLRIGNSITWRLKKIKFKEFIAAAFADLRAKGVKRLVIDLRGNDGGDPDLGYELARHLAQKELPQYSGSRRLVRSVAAHPELLANLDTYSDELKMSLRDGQPASIFKPSPGGFFEILPNEQVTKYPKVVPADDNFRGEAFVISDASNASATFSFLQYVKEHRLASIVGEESGGNLQGINGGNYFFLSLPNSKVEIDIPVYFFAPLQPQKDSPVVPDHPVRIHPRELAQGRDSAMEYILEKWRARRRL